MSVKFLDDAQLVAEVSPLHAASCCEEFDYSVVAERLLIWSFRAVLEKSPRGI